MTHFAPKKIGIIAGGQLGRMFIQSAMKYGVDVHVLDKDPQAPCRDFTPVFVCGDYLDEETVYRFGQSVDILTFEFEHININALERLVKEGKTVYPQPSVLAIVQDKGKQKDFYRHYKIPTADYVLIERKEDIAKHLELLPGFLKSRRLGYDGKGVVKIEGMADIGKGFDAPSVLEKRVDFVKEISVIVACNASGEIITFPTVEMQAHGEKHLLDFLIAPARISVAANQKAQEIARKTAEALGIVGLLAVEMFVTKDDTVLVNEIAPRPHNTGHHTIEANVTSQFEQHLRAILNLPLGSTELRSSAVMVNIIGEEGYKGAVRYQGIEEVCAKSGVYVHLYGKKMTAPFRKMGHITVLDKDINKAWETAQWVKQKVKVIA